jgi:hypothetical protein
VELICDQEVKRCDTRASPTRCFCFAFYCCCCDVAWRRRRQLLLEGRLMMMLLLLALFTRDSRRSNVKRGSVAVVDILVKDIFLRNEISKKILLRAYNVEFLVYEKKKKVYL